MQQARLRQVPEVDQLPPAWAPHALVVERPDGTLELLLVVTGHADATEAQVLADLQAGMMASRHVRRLVDCQRQIMGVSNWCVVCCRPCTAARQHR